MASWYFYLINIWRKESNKTASEKSPVMLLPLQLLTDRVKTLSQNLPIAFHKGLEQAALKLKTSESMWVKNQPGFSCDVNNKFFLFLL